MFSFPPISLGVVRPLDMAIIKIQNLFKTPLEQTLHFHIDLFRPYDHLKIQNKIFTKCGGHVQKCKFITKR